MNPFYQTVTDRKKMRREIRWLLGSTRDDAPTLGPIMGAVRKMNDLVYATSGGRISLVVMDNRTNDCVRPDAVSEAHRTGDEIQPAGGIVLTKDERSKLADLIYEHIAPNRREGVADLVDKIDPTIP
jgi:hypothetical protein